MAATGGAPEGAAPIGAGDIDEAGGWAAIIEPAAGAMAAGIDAARSGVTGSAAICGVDAAGIMGVAAKGPLCTIEPHCVGGPWVDGWTGCIGGGAATTAGGGIGTGTGTGAGGVHGWPSGEPPQAAVVGGEGGLEATRVVAAGCTPCVRYTQLLP